MKYIFHEKGIEKMKRKPSQFIKTLENEMEGAISYVKLVCLINLSKSCEEKPIEPFIKT